MTTSDFISLRQMEDRGQIVIRVSAITSVRPRIKILEDGAEDGFDGSEITMIDGSWAFVEETTRTIAARLGVDL